MNEHLPTFKDWLNQPPIPLEIRTNSDGSLFIPIEYIKPKLNYLSPTWSTKNYHHFFYKEPVFDKAGTKLGETTIVSGSVELHLRIIETKKNWMNEEMYTREDVIIERVLVGSATFDVREYAPNTHYGATCLSLCIVSAAKELGDFFGRSLNKEILTVPTEPKKISNKIKNTIKNLKTS